jgi:Rap1a immunity proteins
MRLLMSVITLLLLSLGQAHSQPNYGSANHVLPLCKTWLKVADETDVEEVGSIVQIEAIRLTTSGMCAGVVIGISETLQTLKLACPPYHVSNEELVRMVVEEIEKRPERMPEEFSVLAREVMIAAWPCKK